MKIAAHTLGCKLNFTESSALLRQLAAAGHEIVDFGDEADLYIINTCTVTAVAEKKCRTAIRQAIRRNAAAQVAVIGCYAQVEADRLAQIPGVTLVLGNDSKHLLPKMIAQGLAGSRPQTGNATAFTLAYSGADRTRTFFKIQDGCDYFCTYCAIPFARGRSRSATIAETLDMARQIAATGAREIILTGVNTGTFGQQHGEHFLDLLRRLDDIEGILRYRISSIEPNLLTDEIIDFVASSRAFLPHFHIPLQAGSDKVLRLMHRRYDTALYAARLQHIHEVMPHACIAADVITGFNGEDDDTFAQSKAYIQSLPISYLHVFPYSDRPGTAALRLEEKIPVAVRRARSIELGLLSNHLRQKFIDSHLGTTREVLWEHTRVEAPGAQPKMHGWTDNYIRLQRGYDPSLAGTVTPCAVTKSTIVQNFTTVE